MASTYNPSLTTDKDWVRFLAMDRGTTNAGTPTFVITGAALTDEEIAGILSVEANYWLAAARAGDLLVAQYQGLSSKSVDGESVSFAQGGSSTYGEHIRKLREKGARLLLDSTTCKNHTMFNL